MTAARKRGIARGSPAEGWAAARASPHVGQTSALGVHGLPQPRQKAGSTRRYVLIRRSAPAETRGV